MNIPHMVTLNEASRLCQENNIGISKNFIRVLIKQDAIPYIRCGVKVLLNYNGLLAYLNNPPTSNPPQSSYIRPVSEKIS